MEPNERFEILNKFKGWGKPKEGIWIVGIEEGGEWTKTKYQENISEKEYHNLVDKDLEESYKKENGIDILDKEVLLNFDESLSRNVKSIMASDIINYNKIENLFFTNLFPLGVRSTKCEDWAIAFNDYKILFNLGENEYIKEKYYERVKKDRFDMLKELWNINIPKLTICHGIKYYNYFIECFLGEKFPVNDYLIDLNRYNFYKIQVGNQMFIISNHLSYSSNSSRFINNINPLINEFLST
jgi:hypothetical protein